MIRCQLTNARLGDLIGLVSRAWRVLVENKQQIGVDPDHIKANPIPQNVERRTHHPAYRSTIPKERPDDVEIRSSPDHA